MNLKKEQSSLLKKIVVVETGGNNPWYNLAFEEYLLQQVEEGELILYLWQNQNTVVIGRNQNPWKECRCQLLESDGGKLARRLSGGGAVFHDLGNLNFTFVMDKSLYNLEKQLEVILRAVRSLGIEAEFSGRNDLVVNERKFSGNAFYFNDRAAYHHGTILLDSDFTSLVKYLQVSREKIESKGIDSVRSRVINLSELKPEINISKMKKALLESFSSLYNNCGIEEENFLVSPSQLEEINDLYKKYSSWEWCYGKSPEFDISYKNRFSWGGVELGFSLKKGIIEEAEIYSDAMEGELIQAFSTALKGISFKLEEIIKSMGIVVENFKGIEDKVRVDKIFADLKNWLYSCDW